MVCSSSMNRTTWPSAATISPSTAFSRSSNSPRNLEPASSAPTSSAHTRRPFRRLGHVAGDDALGEALDDGGLADAGVADQHGVVLRAAAEHLDDAADLVVAADHGVDLAGLGARGRGRRANLRERAVAVLGVLVGDALAAAHAAQRLEQLVAWWRPARFSSSRARPRSSVSAISRCSVATYSSVERLRLHLGAVEHGAEAEARLRQRARAGGAGQLREILLGGPAQRRHVDAGRGEQRVGDGVGLRHEGEQQVDGGQLGVAGRPRALGGGLDGFLGLDGEIG